MSDRFSCFVIMPYSGDSDRLYSDFVVPALRSLSNQVLALRADTMGSQEITLRAHVESAVRSADFCIVDLTGANPNVMYELGYAIAVGKPVLLIRRRGIGLVPSNIVSENLIEYDEGDPLSFRQRLVSALESTIERLPRRKASEVKSQYYNNSSGSELSNLLLGSIRRRFSTIVGSADYLVKSVAPRLKEIDTSELKIEIVSADPESEFSRSRARDLGVPVALYRSEMWRNIKLLQSQLKEFVSAKGLWNCRSELRIFDEVISSSFFITDSIVFVIPYLASEQAREAETFLVSDDISQYRSFSHEFDRVWNLAKCMSQVIPSPPSRGGDEDD